MAIWIFLVLPCLISSFWIYFAPESDIWVKSYDHMSWARAFVVQFRATRYIIGLNRTSESKVMAVWIFHVLPCLISSILVYYVPELDIRVISYDHLNFSSASVVQFQTTRYVIGLNRTSESKVMAIWICLVLPCLISCISIYNAPELDIWVKSYDHMSLPRASVVQFRVTRCIIGLNRTSKSKVMAAWICLALWFLFSSILIYYAPESEIQVKGYDHLNFSRASIVQLWASHYIIALNQTAESKVLAVWICLALWCLISSILIYYVP